jgi:colanic acid/amylovoran biosynthesis glycosyltransferase
MLQGEVHPAPVVAHLVTRFLPATETFVYTFVSRQRRYRSVVVTEGRDNEALFPHPELVVRGGTLARLDRFGQWLTTRRRPALGRWLGYWSPFTTRALARLRPRVVHAHFGWSGCKAVAARAAGGPPLVTSFYGLDASALAREPLWRAHFTRLFRHGDLFLAEGSAMARTLADLGCPRSKLRIQHIGIDPDRFAFLPRTLDRGAQPVVAMCASFREKKGHRYALDAFAQLRRRGVKARLRVIGDGPLRDELHAHARAQELGDVEWLGMRPHAECAEILRSAHVFLHPSVRAQNGDREGGAPTILLEAQATGMPVVATLHDDIPEVTRNGHSALLVPERDADALATALEDVLTHPDRWPGMGEAGRAHVLAAYDAAREVDRLADLYDEAAERWQAERRQAAR